MSTDSQVKRGMRFLIGIRHSCVSDDEVLQLCCGQVLRDIRKERDMTQEDLATVLVMNQSTLSRTERGERPLDANELFHLKILGVGYDDFYCRALEYMDMLNNLTPENS